jgi:hypothetical protein
VRKTNLPNLAREEAERLIFSIINEKQRSGIKDIVG